MTETPGGFTPLQDEGGVSEEIVYQDEGAVGIAYSTLAENVPADHGEVLVEEQAVMETMEVQDDLMVGPASPMFEQEAVVESGVYDDGYGPASPDQQMADDAFIEQGPASPDMDYAPASPSGDGPASPDASPMYSPPPAGPTSPGEYYPGSPDGPMSPDGPGSPAGIEGPVSPMYDGPQSPDDGKYDPASPDGLEGPASPRADGPQSPDGPRSPDGPASPFDGPQSPDGPDGPASPMGDGPQSPDGPASPVADAPYSPDGPASPVADAPYSPDGPASAAADAPYSPDDPASPVADAPYSPDGPGPASPIADGAHSPDGPQSPSGADGPASPTVDGPASPAADGPASPAGPGSPDSGRRSRSGSRSPSPNRSRSGTPASMRSGSRSRSRSGSRSRSRSGSRARSHSGSRSRSRSHSGSRSRSHSGSRSRSRSGSRARSHSGSRSRSRSHSGSRSRSGSPRSRSGSRSMSRSVSRSRSRSRSGSRSSRSRSRSMSRSRSRSMSRSRSRSPGRAAAVIADIFGSSDEEEEFEGFNANDLQTSAKKADDEDEDRPQEAKRPAEPDSDDDRPTQTEFVSDFELMLAKKKEEMNKRRKKIKDIDIVNDNDDLIADLIKHMKEAAEEDRALNEQKKPAIRKLRLLPHVVTQLRKTDLHLVFLDCGILTGITEWLAPLPDKSLPNLKIREALLRQLIDFPPINTELLLKMSGVGKAVMYLYKHPKEIRVNKEMCGKLVNDWSRPIFNLTSNYKMLSREEREQRDYEHLPKKRRLGLEGGDTPRRDIERALQDKAGAPKPGDPDWVMRARVPQPSKKDYVVRPKWVVEEIPRGAGKKTLTRYERKMREMAEKKKHNKAQRAVTISIEGRNMGM